MVLRQIPPMTNDIPNCIQQRAVTVLKIAKLLKSGADFNIHSDDRKTPLDQAFDAGKLDVGTFLYGHEAEANALEGVKPSKTILRPQNKIVQVGLYGKVGRRRMHRTASSHRCTPRQKMDNLSLPLIT